jgi:hypothetical protein
LIDIGTGLGRGYNNSIWLENFDHRLKKIIDKGCCDAVIITDVRFRNEFDHVKKHNFFTIRLLRETETVVNHQSDLGQTEILDSEFDLVINNNKSLKELKEIVKDMAENWK